MKIGIVTIGDEILIGQIVDTNSAWIAKTLSNNGFSIKTIISVGDRRQDILDGIDEGFKKSDILLLTGGIGPTKDDITKLTLCEYFNSKLVMDSEVLNNIKRQFAQKNIKLNELTENQALVPDKCTVLSNDVGTAPLLWFERNDGKVLVSMPGVPYEMKWGMTNKIIPKIKARFNGVKYTKATLVVAGCTESLLAIKLSDFEDSLPENFSLAYLPSLGFIRLRLSVKGNDEESTFAKYLSILEDELGSLLISKGDDFLEKILSEKLKEKGYSLSLAESCSGGYISHLITLHAGASSFYKGGVVSYDNDAKVDMLGVNPQTLINHGAVSQAVVEEMALGAKTCFKSDCAIAVSGVAGPEGGTEEKPVGLVWISVICGDRVLTKKYQFGLTREENIRRSANLAMIQLLSVID